MNTWFLLSIIVLGGSIAALQINEMLSVLLAGLGVIILLFPRDDGGDE